MFRRSIVSAVVCAVVTLAGALPAEAGTSLVKNINRNDPHGSSPGGFTLFGNKVYFAADDGTRGLELWRTNGTRKRTKLVKDINPGAGSSKLSDLAVLGDLLLFRAADSEGDVELWRSDGTASGTELVRDINTSPGEGSVPIQSFNDDTTELVVVGGRAYFVAEDATGDAELWSSDGTSDGTVRAANINPTGDSNPSQLTALGDYLFFRAGDGTNGVELYKLDTSAPSAVPVLIDIHPTGSSVPMSLAAMDEDRIAFTAGDGTSGRELYVMDAAETAPTEIEIQSGGTGSNPTSITPMGGRVYFSARGTLNVDNAAGSTGFELWRSDGTVAGTKPHFFIGAGEASNPSLLTAVGGQLFLQATRFGETEVWRTDAAGREDPSGTFPLDIGPGSSDPFALTAVGSQLYFLATDDVRGHEPWRSDGTLSGTKIVKDVVPGSDGTLLTEFIGRGSRVLFNASTTSLGSELWSTSAGG